MFANHPGMARRWAAHTKDIGSLPERVKKQAGGLVSPITQALKRLPYHQRPRLEQASNIIKDLGRQFDARALEDAFLHDEGLVAAYRPEKFEFLASPLNWREGRPGEVGEFNASNIEKLRGVLRSGKLDNVPWLVMSRIGNPDPSLSRYAPELTRDLTDLSRIMAHEGRHRSRAMAAEGHPLSLLKIFDRAYVPGGAHKSFTQGTTFVPQQPQYQPLVRAKDVFVGEPFQSGGLASLILSMPKRQRLRAERLANEVPGLENMLTEGAIRQLVQFPKSRIAIYRPDAFEEAAMPLRSDAGVDYLRNLLGSGQPFNEPMLMANIRVLQPGIEGELPPPPTWRITGHEGRHRSRALAREGYERAPLMLMTDVRGTDPIKARWPWNYDKLLLNPSRNMDVGPTRDQYNIARFIHEGRDVERPWSRVFLTEPFRRGGLAQL
jgi:hypothetical protein